MKKLLEIEVNGEPAILVVKHKNVHMYAINYGEMLALLKGHMSFSLPFTFISLPCVFIQG